MAMQSCTSRSNSSRAPGLHWAPKCTCGHGYMILKTSHTPSNPGRKFWKCPDWNGENGCGMFIWKDEISMDEMEDANSVVNRSCRVRSLHWAPKCTCGRGYMILKTSHTPFNHGRKFWKCPDWNGENGCGMFIWKDKISMDEMEDANSIVNRSCISYGELCNLSSKLKRMKTRLNSIDAKLDAKVELPRKLFAFIVIVSCVIFVAYVANKAYIFLIFGHTTPSQVEHLEHLDRLLSMVTIILARIHSILSQMGMICASIIKLLKHSVKLF